MPRQPSGKPYDENGLPAEVLAMPVEKLDVDEAVHKLLAAAGPTVRDVVSYANANKGLTKIKGIGDVTEKEIFAAIDMLAAGAAPVETEPPAEVDYVAEHAELLGKLAALEEQYAEVVSQNDRLARELVKAAEAVQEARRAAVPADVVQIVLRREALVAGERCQIGHPLGMVKLHDGVSLNFLVDAVRNGLTREQ